MANTKISQLTPNTNPNGWEELVYAYNNTNGKMTLNTMKTFASSGSQPTLVSWTNIKTINNQSILWPWNIDIQWGGGWADSSYDAVVDASWGWDYTLVSAAIAAWNFNIFVKNGSYTETAWWDAYTKGSSFLRIIWESKKWVQITMPNTITLANRKIIDMRYGSTGANFYMENISFNINLPSNTTFLDYNNNTNNNVVIKNCSFTYEWTGDNIFNKSITVYDCDFISNTSWNINICSSVFTWYRCNFSSASWYKINMNSSNEDIYLYNSVIDTYGLWVFSDSSIYTALNLYNSSLTVKQAMGELQLKQVVDSYVKINDLSVPPTISCAVASNSSIDVSWNSIWFWDTDYHGNRWVSNCQIDAWAITNPINMKWCDISANTFTTSSNCIVVWCDFSSSTAISMANNNSLFIWNTARWTAAFNITGNYSIVVWNQMRQRTITDTSTWSVKDNNITA